MYKLGLTQNNSRYCVQDEDGNIVAEYKYKTKALEHIYALNNNIEFIEKPLSYYKDLG